MCIDGTHLPLWLTAVGTILSFLIGIYIAVVLVRISPVLALVVMVLAACGSIWAITQIAASNGFAC